MPRAASVLLGCSLSALAGPAGRCAPPGPFAARWAGLFCHAWAALTMGPGSAGRWVEWVVAGPLVCKVIDKIVFENKRVKSI